MKCFWSLLAITLACAIALGSAIARRDAADVACFLIVTLVLLAALRAYLRRWRELERWEAWRTAEANITWRGGNR